MHVLVTKLFPNTQSWSEANNLNEFKESYTGIATNIAG